ncbi:MAG: hypothetical protein U0641_02995 [Anaerolineae bacterium]
MYATIHRTEQWFSHHHLALALLIALLAAVIVGGARYVTLPRPAPSAINALTDNAATSGVAGYIAAHAAVPAQAAVEAGAQGVAGYIGAHAAMSATDPTLELLPGAFSNARSGPY